MHANKQARTCPPPPVWFANEPPCYHSRREPSQRRPSWLRWQPLTPALRGTSACALLCIRQLRDVATRCRVLCLWGGLPVAGVWCLDGLDWLDGMGGLVFVLQASWP